MPVVQKIFQIGFGNEAASPEAVAPELAGLYPAVNSRVANTQPLRDFGNTKKSPAALTFVGH
jgi:hypothetical protein